MMNNEITNYAEYLFSLALKKCKNIDDAEDLTQDTLIAAIQFVNRGGKIQNMKYWLSSVLSNKWNDVLRRKYKLPIVSIDAIPEIVTYNCESTDNNMPSIEQLRREIAYLAKLQREVIIKHHIDGKKVQDIADELQIPKGTVLSRLSSGRDQMRKGFNSMESYEKQSYIPEKLEITCSGAPGFNDEPWSLVSNDLVKQNILLLAYAKPVTTVEIAKALGIPCPYIENAVNDLINSELMTCIGNKVVTDFLITDPQERIEKLHPQLEFADEYYNEVWALITDLFEDIDKLSWFGSLSDLEKTDLKYYALIDVLCRGEFQALKHIVDTKEEYHERLNGGDWIAFGTRYRSDYVFENDISTKYCFGGERRTRWEKYLGNESIELHVYDTQPDLNKYEHGPVEIHDDNLCKLLFIIHKGIPFEYTGFNLRYLEDIPHLVSCGVLHYENNTPQVSVPVLSKSQFDELFNLSASYMVKLGEILNDPLKTLLPKLRMDIPSHLENKIAEFRKYVFYAFPMAIVKKAIASGDFSLNGHTSIPMVLTIE